MIFGWAIHGLFGAKDMSGYWPAGRGAICCAWLPDWPSDWPSDWLPERIFVPPISFFKIDHFALLAKGMSMVGAILQKMAVFLKENALTPNFFHFTIVKVIIGRFSNRTWAKTRIPPGRDPILATQRIPRGRDPIISTQRLPRGRKPILSIQRLLCGRDPSSSTQRCPRGRDRIFSTQRFSWGNQWYIQNISALRAPICQEFPKNLFWKSWKLKDKFSNREWIIYEGDAAGRCTSCTSNLVAQVTKVAQVAPLCR